MPFIRVIPGGSWRFANALLASEPECATCESRWHIATWKALAEDKRKQTVTPNEYDTGVQLSVNKCCPGQSPPGTINGKAKQERKRKPKRK